MQRQLKNKGAALSFPRRFDPDAAAVMFDDTAAQGQSHAGSGKALARLEAAEELKQPTDLLRIDTDAVVAHTDPPNLS